MLMIHAFADWRKFQVIQVYCLLHWGIVQWKQTYVVRNCYFSTNVLRVLMMFVLLGLDSPPSSWCIINQDRQTRALVAKEGDLFLLDQGGQYQEQVCLLNVLIMSMLHLHCCVTVLLGWHDSFTLPDSETDTDSDKMYTKTPLKFAPVSCFTRVCPSIHPSVCPHLAGWGEGGIPRPGPKSSQGGYPSQVQARGTPCRGVPHLGYNTAPPHWTWPGVVPHRGKQMEYLIRRGRYASCVHAGGLSCLWVVWTPPHNSIQVIYCQSLSLSQCLPNTPVISQGC